MPFDALLLTPRSMYFPEGRGGGWPCAGFYSTNQTSCFWMNLQTIWMRNLSSGLNNIWIATKGRLSLSPTTGTSLIMWQDGFWNSTGESAFLLKATTAPGLNRSRDAWRLRGGGSQAGKAGGGGGWKRGSGRGGKR